MAEKSVEVTWKSLNPDEMLQFEDAMTKELDSLLVNEVVRRGFQKELAGFKPERAL